MRLGISFTLLVAITAACSTVQNGNGPSAPVASGAAPALTKPERDELLRLLSIEDDDYPFERAGLETFVLEHDRAALPVLEAAASGKASEERERALRALAYMGGDEAVSVLRREYRRTRDAWTKMMLCAAMGSTGTPSDRRFLIKTVNSREGSEYGDDWPAATNAALALGVLHATEAKESLKHLAQFDEMAAEALRWIDEGPWSVSTPVPATEEDRAICTLFANGLAGVRQDTCLYDEDRHRVWSLHGKQWTWETAEKAPEKKPSLHYSVCISSDRQRAQVSLGVVRGPKNGIGHDYVLHRLGDDWKITGLFFTWIS